MDRIIRWYNTNRKLVWRTIIVAIAIIILIQLLNKFTRDRNNSEIDISNVTEKETTNSIVMADDKSVISGESISKSQTNLLKTLDEFAEYCNNGDIDNAYGLLSEDCKNEMYKTKEVFEMSYYNQIFNEKRNISVENWIGNIYKVKYRQDALSTGVYDENAIQDYITIIRDENNEAKLNINGYIGKEKVSASKQNNYITAKVTETDVYMDYQTYTFEITNNSDKTILLSNPNKDSSMYIQDKNGMQYESYTHEISLAELKILPKETRKLTIKYYSKYGSNKKINSIMFSKIILDYDSYSIDNDNYNNYGTIEIKL